MKQLKIFLGCVVGGLLASLPLNCKAMNKPDEQKKFPPIIQLMQKAGIEQVPLQNLNIKINHPEAIAKRRIWRDEERRRYKEYVGNFNWTEAHEILCVIKPIVGDKLKRIPLNALVRTLSKELDIKIDRLALRKKACTIKWFDNNWSVINPFLMEHKIIFTDNGMQIN